MAVSSSWSPALQPKDPLEVLWNDSVSGGESGERETTQSRWKTGAMRRPRRKHRIGGGGEGGEPADDWMEGVLISELRKADRGTWDMRVGLAWLMRELIFSASLLQASIWKTRKRCPEMNGF